LDPSERLQEKQIASALGERLALFLIDLLEVLPIGISHGADAAGDERAAGRIAGDGRAGQIERANLILETGLGQRDAVRAEGVGLDHLRARGDVFARDVEDQMGPAQVELVERPLGQAAAAQELRPHRSGTQQDPLLEFREEAHHFAGGRAGDQAGVWIWPRWYVSRRAVFSFTFWMYSSRKPSRVETNTTSVPSGDQEGSSASESVGVIRWAFFPAASMIQIAAFPSRSDGQAIHLPSRDHDGRPSHARSFVRGFTSLPSGFIE